jgi:transcriptional regulator NrdR family protein
MTVIKKGGKIEEFKEEKIKRSLSAAFSNISDLSAEEKDRIIATVLDKVLDFVKKRGTVFSSEIEAEILIELNKLYPKVISYWREYRKNKRN